MNSLVFLSGLPRTGTTVLSSILNQNPKIHCTSTSGLLDFLSGVNYVYDKVSERSSEFNEAQLKNIFKGIVNSYYDHLNDKIVIDKWRGWTANIPQIKEIISETPKIICTYRPIEEIITSFLFLLEKDPLNFVDKQLSKRNISIDNNNRAKYLWNEGVVGETYEFFKQSLKYKTEICYISYNDIVNSPTHIINKIYDYIKSNRYNHTYDNLDTNVTDNDSFWNIGGLHSIRSVLELERKNPYDYMDKNLVDEFKNFNTIFSKVQ